MRAEVKRERESEEYWFEEGCYISEIANDDGDDLSIARARLKPHSTTQPHILIGTAERYVIIEGQGRVEVGDDLTEDVLPGDVVRIPPNTRQLIHNTGTADLVFYVICSPSFRKECYQAV